MVNYTQPKRISSQILIFSCSLVHLPCAEQPLQLPSPRLPFFYLRKLVLCKQRQPSGARPRKKALRAAKARTKRDDLPVDPHPLFSRAYAAHRPCAGTVPAQLEEVRVVFHQRWPTNRAQSASRQALRENEKGGDTLTAARS
jgi:hypothetical protein